MRGAWRRYRRRLYVWARRTRIIMARRRQRRRDRREGKRRARTYR